MPMKVYGERHVGLNKQFSIAEVTGGSLERHVDAASILS